MNLDKFTQKAQEAVLEAQRLAGEYNHTQIEPEHLLLALVEQSEGIVPEIFRKTGVEPGPFAASLREELSRLPQAYGGSQPSMSPRLRKVADEAQSEATRLKDEFVSTEHVLLGLVELPGAIFRIRRQERMFTCSMCESRGCCMGAWCVRKARVPTETARRC